MPVASHRWTALTHSEFKEWVDAGGPKARHEVMRVTGKGKSTVSTWVLGRCAPPPDQQEAIVALMHAGPQGATAPAGSLPLDRQRAAQRAAGLAKRPPSGEPSVSIGEAELEKCLERALERLVQGNKGQVVVGGAQFGGAPVLGVVPVVVTIRIEDARSGEG